MGTVHVFLGIINFRYNTLLSYSMRGIVVEWSERLDYSAESCRKVMSLRLGFVMRWLENSFCKPSSEWVPFSN